MEPQGTRRHASGPSPAATARRTSRTLAVGLAGLLAAVLAGLAVSGLLADRAARIREAESLAAGMARVLAEHSRRSLDAVDRSLAVLAADIRARPEALDEEDPETGRLARQLAASFDTIQGVSVFRADGLRVNGSLPAPPGTGVADRSYFRALADDPARARFVSEPIVSRLTGRRQVVLSTALRGEDGALQAVLIAGFYIDYFSGFYDEAQMGPGGRMGLVREDGVVLAASHDERSAVAPWVVGRPRDEVRGTGDWTDGAGSARIVAFERVPGYPLAVYASLARDDVLAAWRGRAAWTACGGAALLAALGALAGLLGRARSREWRLGERLREFASAVDDVIMVQDRRGRLEYVSPGVRALTGRRPEDLVGATPLDLVHPDDRDGLDDAIRRIRTEGSGTLRLRIVHLDGRTTWVEVAMRAVARGAGETGLLSVTRDITDRKAEEEALVAAKAQAEAANRAKSEFLAVMSHELRTPLNAVIGFSELIESGVADAARTREYAGLVRDAGTHLKDVIDDLLDFAQVDSGRLSVESVPTGLGPAVEAVVRTLRLSAERAGLDLAWEAAPDAPEAALADPGRLRQVLLNLVGNAIKFTDEGGVRVRVGRDPDRPGMVRVEVEDTGIGIAGPDVGRLFTAFYQVESALARRHGGTGLGLAISQRLVELMGGAIGVETEPGRGSRFWFSLPAAPRDGAEVRRAAA
jgi:two-component system sensor histidine kinase/response regulator